MVFGFALTSLTLPWQLASALKSRVFTTSEFSSPKIEKHKVHLFEFELKFAWNRPRCLLNIYSLPWCRSLSSPPVSVLQAEMRAIQKLRKTKTFNTSMTMYTINPIFGR